MNKNFVKFAATTFAGAALLFSPAALADAGKAIFVYGKAYVQSADGDRRALTKGAEVDSGDTVITASNGRVQLQMADGGLLALRPSTEFVIEQFQLGSEAPADVLAGKSEPRSFFVLVKGGFRSITGAIGKENKSNYRVKTPVATIGIRGTDYDALYCANDCGAYSRAVGRTVNNGLYVGVNSGGVSMKTGVGALDLDSGQFGFAADASTVPSKSADAASLLSARTTAAVANDQVDDTAAPAPDSGLAAQDASGNRTDLNTGGEVTTGSTGAVAFTDVAGVADGVSAAASSAQVRNAAGDLVGFNNTESSVALVNSSPVNVGRDDNRANATGLNWGRWAAGSTVETSTAAGVQSSTLDSDVHYVSASADSQSPVVPTTGTASFDLVGNTDPTDNRGNVGTLGSANLSADFTAQTVDADVSLSFQETSEVWNASAQDVDINSDDASFAGEFDSVTVTSDSGVAEGSGDLNGFFSGGADGAVDGAGLTFGLTQGEVEVDGSAAFERGD